MSGKLAASRATAAGSSVRAGLRVARRSGAWRKRDAGDGAPAEELVDPLADHIGGMLNLDRRRALDAQHQRAGLALLAVGRAYAIGF